MFSRLPALCQGYDYDLNLIFEFTLSFGQIKSCGKACGAEVRAERKKKCMSFVKGSP